MMQIWEAGVQINELKGLYPASTVVCLAKDKRTSSPRAYSLKDLTSAFVLLAGGISCSMVSFACELFFAKKFKRSNDVSPLEVR